MADSKKPSIPAWQQPSFNAASKSDDKTLELARRFLADESVRNANPAEKRAFLKRKGLGDAQITRLLDGAPEESQSSLTSHSATESSAKQDDVVEQREIDTQEASSPSTDDAVLEESAPAESASEESAPAESSAEEATPAESAPEASASAESVATASAPTEPAPIGSAPTESVPAVPAPAAAAADSPPPIVTYPEFLTKSQRPPPLITPSRLANIVALSGGVWALLYGIAGLAVGPMADKLNESRAEYYDHVNRKLVQLVEKLEGTASEVPYKNGKPLKSQQHDRVINDNESVSSDPTELFHRDIGTQTSPAPSITGTTSHAINSTEKPVDTQAQRLSAIGVALRDMGTMHMENAASRADLRSQVEEIQGQLDKLAYPPIHDFSMYGVFGYGQNTEPDDEFKKTKAAIRSVKGLLLSTRSFPVVATK